MRSRFESLLRGGFQDDHARALAVRSDVDLHRAIALRERGCPSELADRVLA